MKTSTRIIDDDLKGCMEGGFYEITITGKNPRNFCMGKPFNG